MRQVKQQTSPFLCLKKIRRRRRKEKKLTSVLTRGQSYLGNVINNQIVPTATTRQSKNPATGQPLWEVPVASQKDLDDAVNHARDAFKTWSKTTHEERSKLMLAFAEAIEKHTPELINLLTTEQGKPHAVSGMELSMTVTWLKTFATMQVKDEVLQDDDEKTIYATFPPIGVCGAIVPWNWPILLGLGKVGPALMTGNTIIMKPSPFTPYCDLKLGEIGASIFPPGVFQVLSGDDSLGPWMSEHPGIDMITFTGSTATGKKVAASCAKTLKRVLLELGGNDAAIVCEDADISKSMPKIATLAFINSGQICMCVKRIYVHEKIYDDFKAAMVDFTKNNIKSGAGTEEGVTVAPIQNENQYVSAHPITYFRWRVLRKVKRSLTCLDSTLSSKSTPTSTNEATMSRYPAKSSKAKAT